MDNAGNMSERCVIVKGVGGLYGVRPLSDSGEPGEMRLARARGIFRHEGVTPLPGDLAEVVREAGETASRTPGDVRVDDVIVGIRPRKNDLIRPPMANLTHLCAVISAARPAPDLLMADKLISIAEHKGIEPIPVITKTDLDPEGAAAMAETYRKGGFRVFPVSSVSGEGLAALRAHLEKLAGESLTILAFAGASGVGKSSVMTALFPDLALATGSVSRKTERGRHTTRQVELFAEPAGSAWLWVADTPGFSMLDFTRFNFYPSEDLAWTFREFRDRLGNCRYTKCTHTKEEGCAVLQAVRAGEIGRSRQESYSAMFEEFKKKPDWKRRQEENRGSN